MLTGHAELIAWMLSYDCMRGAAVVLGVLSTTHGPRPMTERVSHGDCSAVVHPRTVFGVQGWTPRKVLKK